MGVAPRKVVGSLTFVREFERLLSEWPADTKRPLTVIADLTGIPIPIVVDYMGDVIDQTLDIHDPIPYKEAEKAFQMIKQRFRADINAEERREQKHRDRAGLVYESTMEKVRTLQASKNWYSAYRTLAYFAGSHSQYLSLEFVTILCNDCLRLGTKADVNFQELASWLRKGIETSLKCASVDSIADALDFIDAYGEYFLRDKSGRGQSFISSLLAQLNPSAVEMGMAEKLATIETDLNLPAPSPRL